MATPYIGNNDYRGYLNYLATNGDQNAATLLNLVGNDGKFSTGSQFMAPLNNDILQYNQNAYNTWANGGPTTTTSTNGAADTSAQAKADEQAYWDSQIGNIDQSLGRLPTQEQIGNQNIDNSYGQAFNTLTGQKDIATRDYNTTRNNTLTDQETAKSNIDTGVGNTLRGARNILSGRGSGASSAFETLAPFAAGLQGNQQRQQVQNTFGRNLQGLDTNWGDTSNKFTDAFGNLITQRDTQRNQLHSGILQKEADLNQAKGDALTNKGIAGGASYAVASGARSPYQARVQSLLASIDQLGANPTFTPNAPTYTPPKLDAYTYDRYAAPTAGRSSGAAQAVGPYINLLTGDPNDPNKKDPNQGAIVAAG